MRRLPLHLRELGLRRLLPRAVVLVTAQYEFPLLDKFDFMTDHCLLFIGSPASWSVTQFKTMRPDPLLILKKKYLAHFGKKRLEKKRPKPRRRDERCPI
jgi:hypothetical protein